MADLSDGSRKDIPHWTVSHFDFDDEEASFAIRCNGKLFHIDVTAEDLGDWPGKQEFLRLLQDAPEHYDAEESLQDLILLPTVMPVFATHAAAAEDADLLTLRKFYSPETNIFKLSGDSNGIKAVRCPDDDARNARLLPQIPMSEVPNNSKVLQLDVSTIRIVPSENPYADPISDNPSTISVGSIHYHFKVVQDHHSFLREFAILLRLKEKRLTQKYRLPTIYSLVYYSDKPDCILGMLLNRINTEHTMAEWLRERNPPCSLKEKWYNQITNTVGVLHRHGIVWGDVKPENVVIDYDRNSWLIDFGGGFNCSYVDEDVMETTEGDLQGLSRMEADLLQ